jgi:hypothetical protein
VLRTAEGIEDRSHFILTKQIMYQVLPGNKPRRSIMTIQDDFKSLKMVPHKKNRGEPHTNNQPTTSTKSLSNAGSLLCLPVHQSSKSIISRKTINVRSASMSPQTQASASSTEFILQHPATAFGSRRALSSGRNATFSGTIGSERYNSWASNDSGSATTGTSVTRYATILQPRSGSHGNLHCLSVDNTTEFIPVPHSRQYYHGGNIPLPGVTAPCVTGMNCTVTKAPIDVGMVDENVHTMTTNTAFSQRMAIKGSEAGHTTTTPRVSHTVGAVRVTGGTTPTSSTFPSSIDMSIFCTPVLSERHGNTPPQQHRCTTHRDVARFSLPRHVSLRPRAKSFRNRLSITRGVRRHHSESSVLFASRSGFATTTLNMSYPIEDDESVQTNGSNENSTTSNGSNDVGEGLTTLPPVFPRW